MIISSELIGGQIQHFQQVFSFGEPKFHLDLLIFFKISTIWIILKWDKKPKGKVSWSKFPSIGWNYSFQKKVLLDLGKNFNGKDVEFVY